MQGRIFYKDIRGTEPVPGLITTNFGGYLPSDIEFVSAFDIDTRKVDKDLSEAIFSKPNCTTVFQSNIPNLNCPVLPGYILDGVSDHNKNFPIDERFDPIEDVYKNEKYARNAITSILKDKKVEVLVNFLPVGSEKGAYFYAQAALDAGVAFVNAMPVFVSKEWGYKFKETGIPILGDDIKSQVGATLIHRVLTKVFEDRGQPVKHSYQLNVGGNTDFMNMLDRTRLESKRKSKTQSVTSQMKTKIPDRDIYIGPSDYVPWLADNKVCFMRLEALQFGNVPMNVEVRLSVEDSPNSAGVMTDAIRAARVALDRNLSGPIVEATSYLFKSPTQQFDDSTAREMIKKFSGVN